MEKKSTFTGSNFDLIWRSIVVALGMSFTILIATPWLLSWLGKWFFDNVIIDGKKMRFDAEGRDLLKPVYILLLVAIFTLGIGTIFMMAWFLRKVSPFLHHECEEVVPA